MPCSQNLDVFEASAFAIKWNVIIFKFVKDQTTLKCVFLLIHKHEQRMAVDNVLLLCIKIFHLQQWGLCYNNCSTTDQHYRLALFEWDLYKQFIIIVFYIFIYTVDIVYLKYFHAFMTGIARVTCWIRI